MTKKKGNYLNQLLLLLRLHSRLSESPVRIILLHSFLSRASSSFLVITLRSSSIQSCHLLFGLPLLLLPTTRFLILLPTCDSSLLIMWPNHLNLVSRNFCPSSTTSLLLLTSSFLILSSLVTTTQSRESLFIDDQMPPPPANKEMEQVASNRKGGIYSI